MARVGRPLRWRVAGTAATFVLAAVAGVVGNQLTGQETWALVAFVALLAAGTAVTFALERSADRRIGDEDRQDSPGGRPDFRHVQGLQLGDHNKQTNYFGAEASPDYRE
jgi:hypothetical protein